MTDKISFKDMAPLLDRAVTKWIGAAYPHRKKYPDDMARYKRDLATARNAVARLAEDNGND